MKLSIPDHILRLKPYVAGKPLEELEREYGITDAVKLASNENPLGPSPMAVKAIRQAVEITELNEYLDIINAVISLPLFARIHEEGIKVVLGGDGSDELKEGALFRRASSLRNRQ